MNEKFEWFLRLWRELAKWFYGKFRNLKKRSKTMANDLNLHENPGVNDEQNEAVENLQSAKKKQSCERGDSSNYETSETQEADKVNLCSNNAKSESRGFDRKSEPKSEPTGAANLAGFSVEKFRALEAKCEKFEALEKVVNAFVSAFELAKNSGFGTLDASAFQKSKSDDKEVERLKEKLDEEKERRQKAENDLKDIRDRVAEVQKNFDTSEINKKDFESKFENEQKARQRLKKEKEELESEKSRLESDLKNKERELKETKNELNGKISNLESELTKRDTQLETTMNRIEMLNKQNDELTKNLATEQAEVNNLKNEVSELKGECKTLESKLDTTEENLSKTKSELTNTKDELETANKKVAQMRRDFGLEVFESYKRLPAEFRESFGFIDGKSAATFLVTCVTRNTVVNLYENVKNRILRDFEYVEVAKFFDEVFGLAEGIFEFERLLPQVGDAFNSNKEDAINLSRTSRGEIQEVVFCGFRDGKKIYESIVRT